MCHVTAPVVVRAHRGTVQERFLARRILARMVRLRRTLVALVIVVSTSALAACGEPPEKEMQQAQGAIDAARAVGAAQYARDEFEAASAALQRAREATDARDYRLALNHALDSRERAQNAAREAADNKAAARVAADRAVSSATEALTAAGRQSADLEARKAPVKVLSGARQSLALAEQQLQEARAAFDGGDFPAATSAATASALTLAEIRRALEATPTPAPRRGR